MAHDKKLHLGAGVVIAVLVGVAGMLKECMDWCCYRRFDWKDMVVTWLGGFVGLIIAMMLRT